MDDYIQISKLNDFYFCPASLFLRNIYNNYEEHVFYGTEVTAGKTVHKSIDTESYSSKKNILLSTPLFCERFKLVGKADIVDLDKRELIERKNKVNRIFKGYIYQLYAQYFCLLEKGIKINSLIIRSLQDNKVYSFAIPNKKEEKEFEEFVLSIKNFKLENFVQPIEAKCKKCIYIHLCPYVRS